MGLVSEATRSVFGMRKQALEKWTKPRDYFGEEYWDYYWGPGRHRDSDHFENSNYEAAKAILEEAAQADEAEWEAKGLDPDEEPPVVDARASHFAVGWVENLMVHQQATHAVAALEDIESRLEDYPVLDDDDLSTREYEDIIQSYGDYWKSDLVKAFNLSEFYDEEFDLLPKDVQEKFDEALMSAYTENAEHTGREVHLSEDQVEKAFLRNLQNAGLTPIKLYDGTIVGIWGESDLDQLIQDYGEEEIDTSNESSWIHPGQQQLPFMTEGARRMAPSRNVFDKHQIRIAQDTLRMSDVGANIMGGMTKDEARDILARAGWSQDRIRKLEARKKQVVGIKPVKPSKPLHESLPVYVDFSYDLEPENRGGPDEPGYPAHINFSLDEAEMDGIGDLRQFPDLWAALEDGLRRHFEDSMEGASPPRSSSSGKDSVELDAGVLFHVDRVSGEPQTWDYPGSAAYVDLVIVGADMDYVGDLEKYPKFMDALYEAMLQREEEGWDSEDYGPMGEADI